MKIEITIKEDGRKIDKLVGRTFEDILDTIEEKWNINKNGR